MKQLCWKRSSYLGDFCEDYRGYVMLVATLKRSFLSCQQLSKVQLKSVIVGDSEIKPISSARNLWAWFDTKNLSMSIHVSKACKMVYFPSDRSGSIYRKMLPKSWYTTLWHLRRHLDYCNSLLYGIPKYQHDRLQRILHAAAHIVCLLFRFSHISL